MLQSQKMAPLHTTQGKKRFRRWGQWFFSIWRTIGIHRVVVLDVYSEKWSQKQPRSSLWQILLHCWIGLKIVSQWASGQDDVKNLGASGLGSKRIYNGNHCKKPLSRLIYRTVHDSPCRYGSMDLHGSLRGVSIEPWKTQRLDPQGRN